MPYRISIPLCFRKGSEDKFPNKIQQTNCEELMKANNKIVIFFVYVWAGELAYWKIMKIIINWLAVYEVDVQRMFKHNL